MRVAYYAFIRCRPMVVQQFNMVGGFAHTGELTSLYLPFMCATCDETIETLVDLRTEWERLASLDLPDVVCPSCYRSTEFDDVPELYLSYALGQPRPQPPPEATDIIERHTRNARAPRVEIRKDVAETVTALWLTGRFDKKAYFKRIGDGLQGQVILVLSEVSALLDQGRAGLANLVASVPGGVYLARMPLHLLGDISAICAAHGGAIRSVTLLVPISCQHCGLLMSRDVKADQLRAIYAATEAEGRTTEVDLNAPTADLPDGDDTATEVDPDLLAAAAPSPADELMRCAHCEQPMRLNLSHDALASALALPAEVTPEPVEAYLRSFNGSTWGSGHELPTEFDGAARRPTGDEPLIGRYQIIRTLGEGGMGQVLLARHLGTQNFEKLVVIKRVRRDLLQTSRVLNLFLSEARTAAKLSHRNIVQIFDLGKSDDGYFICMEYVNGVDLAEALSLSHEARLAWPVDICCRIVSELCAALHAAHSFVDEHGNLAPIIHRDVSPSNILLSVDGAVKLADFGVAKTRDESSRPHTEPDAVMGKLGYAAPEQLLGDSERTDHRADIYAAGAVLYECLTLRPFIEVQTDLGAIRRALFEAPPRLQSARADVPARLEEIYQRAVSRDPSDRYRSARALQDDLETVLLAEGRAATTSDLTAWIARLVALKKQRDEEARAPTLGAFARTANLKGRNLP
jgi:eukaryotic-like serine/threonine-protein kinase